MDRYLLILPLKVKVSKKNWFILNLNHYRNANYFVLGTAKQKYKQLMYPQIVKLPKMVEVILLYKVFPKTRQLFDIDNVVSIHAKFIQDALTEYGILPDDDYKHVLGFAGEFGEVDKLNPRVELTIKHIK